MTEFFNRQDEKVKRRDLRNSMPQPEIVLWSKLKGKQIRGAKFRRQYSVGPFILDFYSPHYKLAIEVDGESHYQEGADAYDAKRGAYLERFGNGYCGSRTSM